MHRSAWHTISTALLALYAAPAANAGTTVPFGGGFSPGTIVIKTGERRLYYVLGEMRYAIQWRSAGQEGSGPGECT